LAYSNQSEGAYFKVESNSTCRKLSFVALKSRLIKIVNLRIQNGDFTERGLARILGISQSQIHNVLKGARNLKPELADHLMSRLDISVLDLLESGELSGGVVPGLAVEARARVSVARVRRTPTTRAAAQRLKLANIRPD
jgi:transcriptional regulator with XRE-family HTH domain